MLQIARRRHGGVPPLAGLRRRKNWLGKPRNNLFADLRGTPQPVGRISPDPRHPSDVLRGGHWKGPLGPILTGRFPHLSTSAVPHMGDGHENDMACSASPHTAAGYEHDLFTPNEEGFVDLAHKRRRTKGPEIPVSGTVRPPPIAGMGVAPIGATDAWRGLATSASPPSPPCETQALEVPTDRTRDPGPSAPNAAAKRTDRSRSPHLRTC